MTTILPKGRPARVRIEYRSLDTIGPPKPWYVRKTGALVCGTALIPVCLALRLGWNGVAGPPFPFWAVAYIAGAFGILLFYVGVTTPRQQ
jgi:hypothetical protein